MVDTTLPAVAATSTEMVVAVDPSTAAPTTVPIDGAAVLAAAVGALSTTYHFTTAITIDGATVLLADGDRVGDGTRLALTADAGLVNYIVTPEGSWVMPAGGEWEQLDSAPATSDPIAALTAPSAVAVAAADGVTTTLTVTVPAAALGLAAASPDVAVSCEVAEGALRRLRFESVVDGRPAVVTAELAPVVDGSPVVAPI